MRKLVFTVLSLILLLTQVWPAIAQDEVEPLVVFLVRHAEKVDDDRDPELSAEGRQRAEDLAATLRDAGIEHVHSSDYIRTRDTAAPIAGSLGVEVEIYDARNLATLVETLRAAGGRHLVVGHSNTTPEVVALLGGEPGTAIDEALEYDRLYVATVAAEGGVETILLRYGNQSRSELGQKATRTESGGGQTDG